MPSLVSTSHPNGGISRFPSSEIIQFLELSRNGNVMTICKVKLYEAGKRIYNDSYTYGDDDYYDVVMILYYNYFYYICYTFYFFKYYLNSNTLNILISSRCCSYWGGGGGGGGFCCCWWCCCCCCCWWWWWWCAVNVSNGIIISYVSSLWLKDVRVWLCERVSLPLHKHVWRCHRGVLYTRLWEGVERRRV